MPLNDVTVIKRGGGLGRRNPSEDMVSGLLLHGVAVGDVFLNTPVVLYSLRDAEGRGLTRAYDVTNEVLVHYHIDEYFRINPNGELHLMLVAQTVTDWSLLVDVNQQYAPKLLKAAKGRIRQLGVGFNPNEDYEPTLSGGLDAQMPTVISKAQALADSEFALHRPLDIVLEGRHFNGSASAATNLRTLNAENVSIVVAQDRSPNGPLAITAAWDHNLGSKHAAIGTALGTISVARVHENIGWVERFNLTGSGRFLEMGLSSGLALDSYSDTDQGTLHDKGYLFAQRHEGLPGHYWNDSHTCTELASDFAYIENNRTLNKAARLLRTALLPFLKGPLEVTTTGQIANPTAKAIEGAGFNALMQMRRDEEVSAPPDVYVNPEQNVLATSQLLVEFSLIPYATGRKITATLGFTNPAANQ